MKQEQTSRPSNHSEDLFHLIVESVHEFAIFATDLKGHFASWNPGVERLLGYTEGEFVGRHGSVIFTPEDVAHGADRLEMETAAREGRAEDKRWHVRKDGSRFWATGLMMALTDDAGTLRGYAKIMRDETARKLTEDRLSESEARFRDMADDAPVMIWVTDPEAKCTYLSRSWYEFTGQTEEIGLGFGWLDAVHPDDREPSGEVFLKANRRREPFRLDYRLRRKDGEYRWAIDSAAPRFGSGGEFLGYIGSVIDIHDRKQTEERLQESEERLRALTNALPAFVWSTTPDGRVYGFNDRWYEYTGLTREQSEGIGWVDTLHPDDVERCLAIWNDARERGAPYEVEVRYRRKDGEYRWFLARALPVRDADGRVAVWSGTSTDIEDRKRAEEENALLLGEAQEANRLKDEFLATLSHELRTPLTSILGWSRMLQTNNFDEAAARRAIETIERNARAQVQLIDDLLDTSRIITGKLRLDVRAVDLPSVVTAAADTARPSAEAKNIRLQTLLDPHAGPISGDPDRLQQVVWNLVSNAIKFTPKGGRVQVRLERVNSHVEITVSDTGKGIASEFLPHVFDRFRQADQTTTRTHGGLGLGLAIVRQLVELHGGTVHVESAGEGQGTTFTVSLPLLPVRTELRESVPRVHPAVRSGAALDCPPELGGLRVLVVDDEADTRELLVALLEGCGSEVMTAGSAAEGLEMTERQGFDVLVTDIGMPEEDGYSLIGKVRKLPPDRGGNIPAIALTAYARAEDRVRALRSGFQMHVPKPVEPAELITVVANLAGRIGKR